MTDTAEYQVALDRDKAARVAGDAARAKWDQLLPTSPLDTGTAPDTAGLQAALDELEAAESEEAEARKALLLLLTG